MISSMKDFNDRQFLQWKTSKKDYFLNERLDSNWGLRKTWWLDERLAWRRLQKLRKTSFFSSLTKDSDVKERLIFERLVIFFFNLTILLSNCNKGGWMGVFLITFGNKLWWGWDNCKISFVNERHSSRRKTIWVGIQMKSVYFSACRRTNLVLMQIKTYPWHTYFFVERLHGVILFFKVKDILFRCSKVSLHTVVLKLERSRLVGCM